VYERVEIGYIGIAIRFVLFGWWQRVKKGKKEFGSRRGEEGWDGGQNGVDSDKFEGPQFRVAPLLANFRGGPLVLSRGSSELLCKLRNNFGGVFEVKMVEEKKKIKIQKSHKANNRGAQLRFVEPHVQHNC